MEVVNAIVASVAIFVVLAIFVFIVYIGFLKIQTNSIYGEHKEFFNKYGHYLPLIEEYNELLKALSSLKDREMEVYEEIGVNTLTDEISAQGFDPREMRGRGCTEEQINEVATALVRSCINKNPKLAKVLNEQEVLQKQINEIKSKVEPILEKYSIEKRK